MAAYRVGVEISGNRVSMAMVDGQGTVLCRRVFSGHAMGAEQIVETLCDHLEDLLLKRGLQPTDVERIGIGVCGCADETRGVVRSAPALLHVRDVPLAQLVEGRIGVAPSILRTVGQRRMPSTALAVPATGRTCFAYCLTGSLD